MLIRDVTLFWVSGEGPWVGIKLIERLANALYKADGCSLAMAVMQCWKVKDEANLKLPLETT